MLNKALMQKGYISSAFTLLLSNRLGRPSASSAGGRGFDSRSDLKDLVEITLLLDAHCCWVRITTDWLISYQSSSRGKLPRKSRDITKAMLKAAISTNQLTIFK